MLGRISTGSDPVGSNLNRGELRVGRISFGLNHLGSNPVGSNPAWGGSCVGRISCGSNYLGSNPAGSNHAGRIAWVGFRVGRKPMEPLTDYTNLF